MKQCDCRSAKNYYRWFLQRFLGMVLLAPIQKNKAKHWALTKKHGHVVILYSYTKDDSLNTLVFNEMTDEWLDFVVDCRRGKTHNMIVQKGPMADDTIWNYVDDFVRVSKGNILGTSKVQVSYIRYVFCTESLK